MTENNKISVREYLDNKELLEVYYTPYSIKMNIVDTILDNVIDNDSTPATIDTALLKIISLQMFIQNITNLSLSADDNDDENGYDILCLNGELGELLEKIATEYNSFQEVLNDRLNDFYRFEYSPVKVINEIKKEVYATLSSSASLVENTIKNIDVERIIKMFPDVKMPKGGE